MSEESATPSETPSNPPAKPAPRARRSTPRPKKKAKPTPVAEEAPATESAASDQTSGFPEFPESAEASAAPPTDTDWPEPEAASSGDSAAQENPKRKRRRKKGKGNSSQNAAPQVAGENVPQAVEASTESGTPQGQNQPPRQNQAPRPKLDAEALSKCAWKIYLAEISEEGVALVGDNDAKELTRRCFRLAEIFLEEQARRR